MLKSKTTWCVAAMLLGLVLSASARAAEAEPQTYIVLAGIDKYSDAQIKPRAHAEADAKALYDLFTDKKYLGADAGHIRLLLGSEDKGRNAEKATHENIIKAFKWLSDKAGPQDTVVIGLFLQGAPKGESSVYFATDSTYKERDKNAVSSAEIEQEMEKLKSQKVCALLDVNFKGFDSGKDPAPNLNLANAYKEFLGDQEKGTSTGRILFLANSGIKPSLETKDHGLFADVVLTALKGEADKEGYEPDGLVTIDELSEYLEKTFPGKVRDLAKTAEEKEQGYHVLGGRSSHFELTSNPAVSAKAKERLDKFEKLAKDKNLPANVIEEGKQYLTRMPKLEAQRKLRKEYQALVDGKSDVAAFNKERDKILDGTKFSREDALAFAAKIIQATQQVKEDYVKELNQGEMVGWGIKGLYRRIDEPIPQDVKDRLEKIKKLNEKELTELLADVRQKLGKREDLDEHKDIDFTLQRMLSNLDPYTTYIDPATLQRFQQETDASFTGIGVQIRKDTNTDHLLVVTPLKGSPAYQAGIQTGDVITEIRRDVDSEGKKLDKPEVISTKGLSISDAVKNILGKPGTKVKLLVKRGDKEPMEMELTRGLVSVETVLGARRKDDDSWDFLIDHDNRIAYIRISSFATNTLKEVSDAMQLLSKKGINGLVLDLRFNPGGLLSSAVLISDMFIDDGLIVSVRPRVGTERSFSGETSTAFNDGRHRYDLPSYLDFPMVCLVNGGSASGSEIVSAALQDHGRAVIMGERSFGKGSVQNIQNFEGGKLKLTTASFWRPSGKNLNKSSTSGKDEDEWGVSPDKGFNLELTPKEREDLADAQHQTEVIPNRQAKPPAVKKDFKDRQLDMALKYLKEQIDIGQKGKKKAAVESD